MRVLKVAEQATHATRTYLPLSQRGYYGQAESEPGGPEPMSVTFKTVKQGLSPSPSASEIEQSTPKRASSSVKVSRVRDCRRPTPTKAGLRCPGAAEAPVLHKVQAG